MEFEQIYTKYFSDVYLYIRKLSNSEHIAEEITSETFFKAMKSISSFRGECDVRVWLCQIAKNSYYSYMKKTNRTEPVESLEIGEEGASFEERQIHNDTVIQIQKVLHDISEPYKEVFMWRVYADLSFKQIGQIFGKSENWACVTYHRARNKIRERLVVDEYEK
ncbi:MAG: sigma-70 family RNA polymerase sigma factor [Clostridiales bacterium]|nr:sigma-70 family RNA polymerase sigma factor [Clostridiales bacterium]